jgi:hypothetical protein
MTRVSIAASEIDSIEVDLWGTIFHTVPVTRTRQRTLLDLQKKYQELEEDATDEGVALMAQMLDHWLAPEPGKRKKPSDIILQKWEADELTFVQLTALLENLTEAVGRPT